MIVISGQDWVLVFLLFFVAHLVINLVADALRQFLGDLYLSLTGPSRRRKSNERFERRQVDEVLRRERYQAARDSRK